ncbi:MAG TPA: COX15/CtaA family protein [Steroidobacteraceae bacterium]|nr:COX15/CtaA family protein [Steroidobacteraceae bacterium]
MTPRYRLFRRLALAGVVLAFGVVVLGAWVRLSNAGLGCPDWPGCYGHLTADDAAQNADAINQAFPQRPFTYHKAIKEMVHRYFAGGLVLVIVTLAGLAIANRRDPQQPVGLPITLVGLVFLQALLGMWTVTLLLKPLIVVLHLLGGLTTLALLAWLALAPVPSPSSAAERGRNQVGALKTLATTGLIVLGLQIALGGWTSSNYAALACPDFPTCQNSYWPQMDAKDAFVLWRGLGIDYEGGVLDHPARVAIHFVHRLGALVTALVLGFLSFAAIRTGPTRTVRIAGMALGAVLVCQLILGPMMVIRALPLALATAHNAVAALLLLAVVALNRQLRAT